MGLSVRSVPSALGYDLLVNGDLRVTLRVAFPSLRRHRVAVGKRIYRYRYRTWHFNFHHHGKLDTRYTDFFICLAVSEARASLQAETFIIPWEQVTGKTFSLHDGQRQYQGRYAPFRENWDGLLSMTRRRPVLRRVA